VIDTFFKQVKEQSGVESIGVFAFDGAIIDSWSSAKNNEYFIRDLGTTFLHIFNTFARPEMQDINILQLSFDKGMVCAIAAERFVVVVVLRGAANLTLVRMALECAVFEVEHHKVGQKMLYTLPPKALDRKRFEKVDEVEKIMLDHIIE
jgi:predicted regulator of Ras-like GTPase activity (Roadblock/LC7/MglB family)